MNTMHRTISQQSPEEVELAKTFLTEVLASCSSLEIYKDAHDALWHGYFETLRPYIQPETFQALGELGCPAPLQLLSGMAPKEGDRA